MAEERQASYGALESAQLRSEPNVSANLIEGSPDAVQTRTQLKRTRVYLGIAAFIGVLLAIAVVLVATGVISSATEPDPGPPSKHGTKEDPGTGEPGWWKDIDKVLEWMKIHVTIDTHNDLPWAIRQKFGGNTTAAELQNNRTDVGLHTDIPRLKAGGLGAQVWSVYVPCSTQFKDAVRKTLEQIDITKKMIADHPSFFTYATTEAEIRTQFAAGTFPSLMGAEGGHSIDSSFGALRVLFESGVRYMTLTHSCNTPWAESCGAGVAKMDPPLTARGVLVVQEMNRIGMMVDISHVSAGTMNAVLDVARAPVIFSHSSARALCNNTRNVPDDVLRRLPENGGVVMVNFYPEFVTCSETATISDVADHVQYIAKTAGVDHVGFGGDFDGIGIVPKGLSDVSYYADLIKVLFERGFSNDDMAKIAGENFLRVFKKNEDVAAQMQSDKEGLDTRNAMLVEAEVPGDVCRTPN